MYAYQKLTDTTSVTNSYQATANLDFQQPTSKSRKMVETMADGSTHASNQRMKDVDSSCGTTMRLDEK